MEEYVLKKYYEDYLKKIRKVSDSSIRHYVDALKFISKKLVEQGKIQKSIYEINDIDELNNIKDFLYNNADFIELNDRGHHMYSVGMNHYVDFANGKNFDKVNKEIKVLDAEMPVGGKNKHNNSTWKSSSILKEQAVRLANFQCEINKEHTTFTSKKTGHQYMEGHHALPMRLQDKFEKSLDVYANIVSVCPICHRLVHHGIKSEKEKTLKKYTMIELTVLQCVELD